MKPPFIILLVLASCGMPAAVEPEPDFSVTYWQAEWPFSDGTYAERWLIQLDPEADPEVMLYNNAPLEQPWCPDSINAHVFEPIRPDVDEHVFVKGGVRVEVAPPGQE